MRYASKKSGNGIWGKYPSTPILRRLAINQQRNPFYWAKEESEWANWDDLGEGKVDDTGGDWCATGGGA